MDTITQLIDLISLQTVLGIKKNATGLGIDLRDEVRLCKIAVEAAKEHILPVLQQAKEQDLQVYLQMLKSVQTIQDLVDKLTTASLELGFTVMERFAE